MEELKKTFTPEFRNRLDAVIQFSALSVDVIRNVVDKFVEELQHQLDDKDVVLHVDDSAKDWLAELGYDEKMGARPMSRLIQDQLKKPLAESILFGDLSESGGDVFITANDDGIALDVEAHEAV